MEKPTKKRESKAENNESLRDRAFSIHSRLFRLNETLKDSGRLRLKQRLYSLAKFTGAVTAGMALVVAYMSQVKVSDDFEGKDLQSLAGSTSQSDGFTVYGSSDNMTDFMLNYMTGKEVSYQYFVEHVFPHDPLSAMSIIALRLTEQQHAQLTEMIFSGTPVFEMVDWLKDLNIDTIALEEFDHGSYLALWEMHGDYYSPNVDIGSAYNEGERAKYRGSTKTSFIPEGKIGNPSRMIDSYLAELAHHIQRMRQPFHYRAHLHRDHETTERRAMRDGMTYKEAQKAEYDIEGSVEYIAHTIIEEKLKDEFNVRRLLRGDIQSNEDINRFFFSPNISTETKKEFLEVYDNEIARIANEVISDVETFDEMRGFLYFYTLSENTSMPELESFLLSKKSVVLAKLREYLNLWVTSDDLSVTEEIGSILLAFAQKDIYSEFGEMLAVRGLSTDSFVTW